jgi:hypothetical protein
VQHAKRNRRQPSKSRKEDCRDGDGDERRKSFEPPNIVHHGITATGQVNDEEQRQIEKVRSKDIGHRHGIKTCPRGAEDSAHFRQRRCDGNENRSDETLAKSRRLMATIDTALASQNAALAAESLGLGVVYIGGMRNKSQEVSDLLRLPDYSYVTFGMVVAYPAPEAQDRLRPRPSQASCTETDTSQNELLSSLPTRSRSSVFAKTSA